MSKKNETGLSDEELVARVMQTRDQVADLIQEKMGPDSNYADWLTAAELALIEVVRRSAPGDEVQQRRHAGIISGHFAQLSRQGLPVRVEAGQ